VSIPPLATAIGDFSLFFESPDLWVTPFLSFNASLISFQGDSPPPDPEVYIYFPFFSLSVWYGFFFFFFPCPSASVMVRRSVPQVLSLVTQIGKGFVLLPISFLYKKGRMPTLVTPFFPFLVPSLRRPLFPQENQTYTPRRTRQISLFPQFFPPAFSVHSDLTTDVPLLTTELFFPFPFFSTAPVKPLPPKMRYFLFAKRLTYWFSSDEFLSLF